MADGAAGTQVPGGPQGLEEGAGIGGENLSVEPGGVPQGKLRSVSTTCLTACWTYFAVLLSAQAGNESARSLQAWQKLLAQWESLENAKERTFKYWLYR